MHDNQKQYAVGIARSYYGKFAKWDLPEWYFDYTLKSYSTLEWLVRRIYRMNKKEIKKQIDFMLFDFRHWRDDLKSEYGSNYREYICKNAYSF